MPIKNDNDMDSAGKVQEKCRKSAGKVQAKCRQIHDATDETVKLMSEQQRQVYAYIQQNGQITISDAEKLLQVKRRRANFIISEMVELGVIKRVGASRATRYVLL